MKILVYEIFEKGQILRPFSGLAPLKLKICFKKIKWQHICIQDIVPTNFQKSRRGGDGIHPLPGPCGTEKSVVLRGLMKTSSIFASPVSAHHSIACQLPTEIAIPPKQYVCPGNCKKITNFIHHPPPSPSPPHNKNFLILFLFFYTIYVKAK